MNRAIDNIMPYVLILTIAIGMFAVITLLVLIMKQAIWPPVDYQLDKEHWFCSVQHVGFKGAVICDQYNHR